MDYERTRRAVLGALVAGGTGALALSPAGGLLERFAPGSGRVWDGAGAVPDTVESPYGPATITYDDHHVPHVEADSERAAYFGVGYAQAADRLFEMDLIRRRMRGELAEVAGETVVESDVFNVKMDFLGCAEASEQALAGTDTEAMTEAFADGVNAYIEAGPLPVEFGLLGYEPREWQVVDSLLVGVQVAWGLTGSFRTLRRALLRDRLDAETYDDLFPAQFDHGYPILRPDRVGGEIHGLAAGAGGASDASSARVGDAADASLAAWLGRFEPPPYLGSNSWLVAGQHTESGSPIVANDMHLTLMAPPVWYEQRVAADGVDVRGVAFPGVPFVIAGENDHGAWGFTNTGADVLDLYTYETDESRERYRYRGEFREFDTETRTVAVAGGEDREIEVKKTVHGAFLDREIDGETRHVGVAWTGMSGTREARAIHEFSRSTGREDVLEALELFDAPTQNFVYADREGSTLYWATGKLPIRRVDGEVVRGDRVFDGSAGEAEWDGFTPYGQSAWDGFVPFEEKPGVLDPSYVGTANQRLADEPRYPVGQAYASGFRGTRIYEELDAAVAEGGIDREAMQTLQRDTVDIRARELVPAILDAREKMPADAAPYLDAMADWDYRMDRESTAALAFHFFYEAFREETWREYFEQWGLDESYWPQEWVLVTLPPDHEAFAGDRVAVMNDAMTGVAERIETAGYETYGDYNETAIDHPFGSQVPALNYPRYPTDGSPYTVMNFRKDDGAGSSQRNVYPIEGESVSVLPGGNDGSYFSEHYDDQLRAWADGAYKPMPRAIEGEPDITVEGGDEG